jgi:uncharacterized damage-inducible protein DinB
MHKYAIAFAVAACVAPVLNAQGLDTFRKHWKLSGEFTLDVANAMPAENYTFKPNDEEMDFGRVMVHIGLANNNAFAIFGGQDNPTPQAIIAVYKDPKGTFKKADVIQFLTDSFAFGDKVLAAGENSRMNMMLGPENRKMLGVEWIWSYFTHTAHHRGQAEVYMRVKNVKPPAYRF